MTMPYLDSWPSWRELGFLSVGPPVVVSVVRPLVLRSKRAVKVNIEIIRTFVALRNILATNEELACKVHQFDRKVAILYENFQKFLSPPDPPKKHPIGIFIPRIDVGGDL